MTSTAQGAPARTVLVFDGLFLHRPELVRYWDLTVFLVADARREAAWQAYLGRDLPSKETARVAAVAERMASARRARYVEGQRLY